MTFQEQKHRATRLAAAGVISLAALGMAGCDTSGPETGADVEDVQEEGDESGTGDEALATPGEALADPYEGEFDEAFVESDELYIGEEVVLSANVNEIISETSFTIAGTDETTVDPLLIIHEGGTAELAEGMPVQVTGTYQEAFDLLSVEENMDLDLKDDGFENYDEEPYIEASAVDTSVPAEE